MYDINLNVLALCETKLKGRGEELFGDRLGYKGGVGDCNRAREGVVIFQKEDDVGQSKVLEGKRVGAHVIEV